MGNYTAGAATQTVSGGVTTINVPLLINGDPSDMNDSFTFNSDGTLQSASGDAFTLSSVATYPLISPSAGVDQILTQRGEMDRYYGFGPIVRNTAGSRGNGAAGFLPRRHTPGRGER